MTSSSKEGPPSKLTYLIRLLDHAVKAVPAARYIWGVIALSVAVAIISLLSGLNRLTFVAMVAAFGAMLVFYIFSQFEKASDPVLKLLGYGILTVAALGFVFVIVSSAWLALTCTPPVLAYLYGVSGVCYPATPQNRTAGAPPQHAQESAGSLTLYSLYKSDFPNLFKLSGKASVSPQDKAWSAEIEVTEHIDFEENLRFVSFYIPPPESITQDHTFSICVIIHNFHKGNLADWVNGVIASVSGNSTPISSNSMPWGNRVFIYENAMLDLQQKAALDRLFRQEGYELQLRDLQYLAARKTSATAQEHQ